MKCNVLRTSLRVQVASLLVAMGSEEFVCIPTVANGVFGRHSTVTPLLEDAGAPPVVAAPPAVARGTEELFGADWDWNLELGVDAGGSQATGSGRATVPISHPPVVIGMNVTPPGKVVVDETTGVGAWVAEPDFGPRRMLSEFPARRVAILTTARTFRSTSWRGTEVCDGADAGTATYLIPVSVGVAVRRLFRKRRGANAHYSFCCR